MIGRPHVVQAIGELDRDDADAVTIANSILGSSRPGVLGRGKADRVILVTPSTTLGDFRIKSSRMRSMGQRVFDDVVQQAGGDRDHVEFHVGEEIGDGERMNEVGFAGWRTCPRCSNARNVGTLQEFPVQRSGL